LECPDFFWPLLDAGRDLIPVELEAGFLTKFDLVDFDLLGLVFDGFALDRDCTESRCGLVVASALGLRAFALIDLGAASFGLADRGLRKARFLALEIFDAPEDFSIGASVAFLSFTTSSVVN
jgi:hypothetical protein